jgi:FSR family fosmidomycin resistance protein-like MFS transporter
MQLSVAVGLALITFVVMTRSWFQLAMMTYLPEWIQSQGQSIAFGGQVLAVFMIAVGVGSMTGGPLSDWLGRWRVVVISLAVLALAQWLFLNAPIFWQVILVAIMGIMIGASFPVTIVMAQEAWPNGVGLASSLVMGLGWAPGGLGAWFTGWLADQTSLAAGLQSLIVVPLVGVIGVLIYAVWQRR